MHKLGDQWVEIIKGHPHMLKAIDPTCLCQGCLYNGNQGGCMWVHGLDDCESGYRFIIKDLGILNEEGCLPCPWYKEVYPSVYEVGKDSWMAVVESYGITMRATGKTKQQAIDAWNRRA